VGTHLLTASYSGDSTYPAMAFGSYAVTVGAAPAPAIASGGVVNAASGAPAIAQGSLFSI
jgi:hypothetical protein